MSKKRKRRPSQVLLQYGYGCIDISLPTITHFQYLSSPPYVQTHLRGVLRVNGNLLCLLLIAVNRKTACSAMESISYEMNRLPSVEVEANGAIPEPLSEHKITRDEADLIHFGKRQQFKVSAEIRIS